MATVWITKYTLTQGTIQKAEHCEITEGQNGARYASRNVSHCASPDYIFVKLGTDGFLTEEEARKNVQLRIERRIKALNKELTKLLALREEISPS